MGASRADRLGRRWVDQLRRLTGRFPCIGDVRGRGLMVGVELVADRSARWAYPYEEAVGDCVCVAVRKRGVILRPLGDVVVLMPPLSVTPDEIDLLVGATAEAIREVTET